MMHRLSGYCVALSEALSGTAPDSLVALLVRARSLLSILAAIGMVVVPPWCEAAATGKVPHSPVREAAPVWTQAAGSRLAGTALRQEVILHAFICCNDGTNPESDLIRDSSGALYGTDFAWGPPIPLAAGTVFQLTPPAAGANAWQENILQAFSADSTPLGYNPIGGLVGDDKGNFYGTTSAGGNPTGGGGYGTVFELTPVAKTWTYQLLHYFIYTDGAVPTSTLVRDPSSGTLYGTTVSGGTGTGCNGGCGVVFELIPPKAGATAWTEHTVHTFSAADGVSPLGSLLLGQGGVLYGTTSGGGPKSNGTVFALTPPPAGKTDWSEKILHAFTSSAGDGAISDAGLVADKLGDLYGTTSYGGAAGLGCVFKLTPPAAGKTAWTKTSLYAFGLVNNGIGYRPEARLTFDNSGTLYGTTVYGGTTGFGTVFSLTPPSAGKTGWTAKLLHTFDPASGDGASPVAGVVLDDAGNLYGTAKGGGGNQGQGVVYELLK